MVIYLLFTVKWIRYLYKRLQDRLSLLVIRLENFLSVKFIIYLFFSTINEFNVNVEYMCTV